LFAYKNFAGPNVSHIGLGVAALNTAKVLRAHGIRTTVAPVATADQLVQAIRPDVTDVIVSAPWITTPDLGSIIRRFGHVQFAVSCHSNIGFLQADSNGVKLIREYVDLAQGSLNFATASNSRKGARALEKSFAAPNLYLGNMYYLDSTAKPRRALWNGGTLRIGCFGAFRPLKNLMTATNAALLIANELKAATEIWVNSGRAEGGGQTVLEAVKSMVSQIPGIVLMQSPWADWPKFRDLVRSMHLLVNCSYTESFNMVTADGIAEGVPSVVSAAIDWAPKHWTAHFDDSDDVAQIGRSLIHDPGAAEDGLKALETHNADAFRGWMDFLGMSNVFYISHGVR